LWRIKESWNFQTLKLAGLNALKSPVREIPTCRDWISHANAIMTAMQSELTEAARKLSIADRILLVEEIWDTIAEENQAFELSDAQKEELDRRLDSPPHDSRQGRTWDEIKAEFMKSR
jgi:putative addiction module component (TIGR02574 family)